MPTFISYPYFLLLALRFWVLMLAFRRHETEWRVRPCGQRSEDVHIAMDEPSVRFFFALLTFLIQPQKRLAVTLRLRFPPHNAPTSSRVFLTTIDDSSIFLRWAAASAAAAFLRSLSATSPAAAALADLSTTPSNAAFASNEPTLGLLNDRVISATNARFLSCSDPITLCLDN